MFIASCTTDPSSGSGCIEAVARLYIAGRVGDDVGRAQMIVQKIDGRRRGRRRGHLQHHRRAADISLVRDRSAARHHLVAAARHVIGGGGAGLVGIDALEARAVRPVGQRDLVALAVFTAETACEPAKLFKLIPGR